MQIDSTGSCFEATELEVMAQILPLRGARILELGCGRAWMTREICERFSPAAIIATEVDQIQHEKNLRITGLPQVTFLYGGAESIEQPDASFDVVLMLKSLHHVPMDLMGQALEEIRRVLKPGGLVYISEPVYRGAFNDIMRLFHDEKTVRTAAFNAIKTAVEEGVLKLVGQHFFNAPGHYRDFDHFEQRMLKVTHTQHQIDKTLYQQIRSAFMQHMTADGAYFQKPFRVDLLSS